MLDDIGHPKLLPLRTYKYEGHNEHLAPQYVVLPVDWNHMEGDTFDITENAFITDFSSAFAISEPPKSLETLLLYSSLEWVLERKVGVGSDIWGLDCILLEMRNETGMDRAMGPETYSRSA